MSEIVLEHVGKVYDNHVQVVKDFNLTIPDKEFIIFVGPSGCGKSTTLRMIAGLEEITEGNLYVDGELINDVPSYDRNMAMVFQNYALYPHMTVYDNIGYSLKLAGLPKKEIDEKVRETAQILGLESVLKRKPGQLSGGQKQRVAIGRTIVRHPKVFLMDEPLSNLDAKLRAEMRVEIKRLHKELDTTFIYVTHDQVEAMTLGTKIVVLKDGVIQQVGTPSELYEHPANRFVAGFIGTPQMNFIEGICMEEEDGVWLYFDAQKIKIDPRDAFRLQAGNYIGRKVIMGIRSEDLYVDEEHQKKFASSVIEEKLEVREMLGAESLLYFEDGEFQLIAKVASSAEAQRGEIVRIAMDPEKMHFFDPDNGQAIA